MPSAGSSDHTAFDNPLRWFPDLETAIERRPLIVTPDTRLIDVISLISQAHDRCPLWTLSTLDREVAEASSQEHLAGCALVMQGQVLQGILTERDVVRLTASATDFATVAVASVMTSPVVTIAEESVQDIFAALFLLRRYRIRHLPVVDAAGAVVGVISHASLRRVLRPANLLRFRRVADVMSAQVVQASLATPVFQLAQLMAEHRVSCIVITQIDGEGNSRPVGIITERDIVQFQALQLDLARTPAYELMSTPLFLLSPQDSLWMAQQEMQKRHVGRLVVSWNWGQNMGIVTQTSLLRVFDPMEMYSVIENLQQTIQELKGETPEVPFPRPRGDQPPGLTPPPMDQAELGSSLESARSAQTDNPFRPLLAHTVSTLNALMAEPDLSPQDLKTQMQSLIDQLQNSLQGQQRETNSTDVI
ncbi:MAG: CBS domain-containing protein [Leptolyngbya sp. DLM2.Bin15]|nr:MAG: CBS domain-containing protein [Leptolyngbya sp. DLM2.Bin15]